MRIKYLSALLFALVAVVGNVVAQHNVITPVPNVVTWGDAHLDVSRGLKLYIDAPRKDAERLEATLADMGIAMRSVCHPARRGFINLRVVEASALGDIALERNVAEGYVMDITTEGVSIDAASPAGLYYGIQSLKQIYEAHGALTTCHIVDAPRFGYRGVLIDISRHFRTKEFLMRQIDHMAAMKMNRLHLHLTDAAGWRLQVDSYPRLTSYAAWRVPHTWKEWWYGERRHVEEGTEGAYGGYLTKAEARELVAYAADRYITIIPEIEMPGHSDEVLAAYPELRCTQLPERQGDLCIGKEATFAMMQAILDEVIEIFPSEYIHIGGDEASKASWRECDDCRRRMAEEGLEDVDELQSYMIHRIEEYLNARGRQIIGWDEILQGGLAPNATVMSWRGEEGGIAAAAAGHDAIMSPHGYCYIDAPQDAPYSQPESIGGYLPLDKVYSYEPAPESMDAAVRDHIIGVQANLWAEFIPTDEHYEHMLWPRAIAVAEIGWSQPARRDFVLFRERAVRIVDAMLERGYTPFDLKNEIGNRPESLEPVDHLAVGKSVTYLHPSRYYAPQYAAQGDATLTDGLRGTWTYADKRWQGFLGRGGVDVVVDMGDVTHVESIAADFMQICGPGVFMPCRVEIWGSVDGEHYDLLADIEHEVVVDELPSFKSFGWEGSADVRYIRYKAHRSAYSGFLFTDEIVVR
ncbi:MAG: beta-N-acetylhexosaminidase [Alistipes sp.]|nr:beta-N-acetylhexosaminidase [Alistipes sp.]